MPVPVNITGHIDGDKAAAGKHLQPHYKTDARARSAAALVGYGRMPRQRDGMRLLSPARGEDLLGPQPQMPWMFSWVARVKIERISKTYASPPAAPQAIHRCSLLTKRILLIPDNSRGLPAQRDPLKLKLPNIKLICL